MKVLVAGLAAPVPEPPEFVPEPPEPALLPPEPHPAATSASAVTASAATRPRRLPRLTCTESSPSRIVVSRLEGRTAAGPSVTSEVTV